MADKEKEKTVKITPTFHGYMDADGVQHFDGTHDVPVSVAVVEVGLGHARYVDYEAATGNKIEKDSDIPRDQRVPTPEELNPNASAKSRRVHEDRSEHTAGTAEINTEGTAATVHAKPAKGTR